ncbi:MAG: hypothetical protein ACRCZB_05410 [Bacteroidales bacterium]
MEKIFKARCTDIKGISLNGFLIKPELKIYKSTELFLACKRNPKIELFEFCDGEFLPVKPIQRIENSTKETETFFLEEASRAELKAYLLDNGFRRKDYANFNKAELMRLAESVKTESKTEQE